MTTMNTNSGETPLLAGTGAPAPGLELDAGGPRRKILSSQAFVLVLVVGVSAAALITMRQLGARSGMDLSVMKKAEAAPAVADTGDKSARYEHVMQDLQRMQQPLDLALGELGKIPTLLGGAGPKPLAAGGIPTPVTDPAQRELEAKRARLHEAFGKLQLQSVMGGRVPLARINNQNYRIGEQIEGGFTLASVDGRSCVVEGGGEQFELQMEVGKATPGGKPGPGKPRR